MKQLFWGLLFLSSRSLLAGPIISERPGQALSPFCLDQGRYQVQSGFDYFNFESSVNSTQLQSVGHVFRVGMGEKFELNFNLGHDVDFSHLNTPGIGFKMALYNSEKIAWAVQYNTTLHGLTSDTYSNSINFIGNNILNDWFSVYTTFGSGFTNTGVQPFYVVGGGFQLSPTVGWIIENYGDYSAERFQYFFDTGFSYLITENFQIDTYFGGGQNYGETQVFISSGISLRI